MIIDCPSGLSGTIRGMKGREAQAFVDPQLIRTIGSVDTMFTNCWLSTTNPGPYAFDEGSKPMWKNVLIGDRFHLMCEIRGQTFGYDYDFNVTCEGCEKQYGWELDLRALERRKLPAESFEKIRNGDNRFDLELPDGAILTYKLGTGHEEMAITKLKGGVTSQKKLGPVDALWVQTVSLSEPQADGSLKVVPGDRFGWRKRLEDLDYGVLLDVLERVQDSDCGVVTKIETVCEFCSWQQWVEMPFQRSFFASRQKKQTA